MSLFQTVFSIRSHDFNHASPDRTKTNNKKVLKETKQQEKMFISAAQFPCNQGTQTLQEQSWTVLFTSSNDIHQSIKMSSAASIMRTKV